MSAFLEGFYPAAAIAETPARIVPPPLILAFDLSPDAGWARLDGGQFDSGVLDLHALEDEHPGARWPRIRGMFRALARGKRPSIVAWERAVTFGHHHGDGTLPIIQACLVEVVWEWRAESRTLMPATLKKFAVGYGGSKKRKVGKEQMVAAAQTKWPDWRPANPEKPDDEADARWVLAWAMIEAERTEN